MELQLMTTGPIFSDRRSPKKSILVRAGLFVFLLSVLDICSSCAGAQAISVITPTSGSTVRPGADVPFQLQVDPAWLPAEVHILGKSSARFPIGGTLSGGPGYVGSVTIPSDVTGQVNLNISLLRPNGGGLIRGTSTAITLNVVPAEAPQSLRCRGSVTLVHPQHSNPLERKLSVQGIYEGGVTRDITGAMFGTTFTSLTPSIVSIAPDGTLTTLANGYGFILVENQGVQAYTQVIVSDSAMRRPPAVDYTADAVITTTGFRRDPTTGLFTQEVTIRNNGSAPFSKGLDLVVGDLPAGVTLDNAMGAARATPPIGAPLVYVDADERDFLSPGKTATAVLKFRNPEGAPITHTLRLYGGESP